MSDEEVSNTKGELIEKIIFAAIPILLSCVAYLLLALNDMENRIAIMENRIAVVVSAENKPIPPDGTTIAMEQIRADAAASRSELRMEAAMARAELDKRITVLEEKLNRR